MDNIVYLYGAKVSLAPFFVIIYAWELREFREQYQKITEKNDLSFRADKIISVANMYFKSDVKQSDDDYMRSYNIMRLGDIAFEGNKSKHFAHGRFVENTIGDGIVSHVFDVFRPIADYDLLFWKYFINNEGVMGRIMTRCTKASTMMTNLVADDFLAESILVPSIQEQQKIGAFLDKLDFLITLHQRKCETLQKLKKSMLQKMFPKNGSHFPEIRFKGFTDAWELRKFSELYEKNMEKNSDLIGFDKTISIATMTYKDEGNGASDSSLSAYKVLRIGDIAFEGHTSKEFRYGRFVANDIGIGLMSPRFSTLRPIKEMPVDFWKHYIHYEPIMKYILVNATKAGTMMNELVIPEFLEQSLLVPSLKEQAKIGQYFTTLDHLITLHQRKLETLKKLKKAMLQKMFI